MTQERIAVSIPVNGHTCTRCGDTLPTAEQRDYHTIFCGIQPSNDEPRDSFSTRDVEILVTALRLYHGDLMDVRQVTDCLSVQALCERIVRPGRRWVAEDEDHDG